MPHVAVDVEIRDGLAALQLRPGPAAGGTGFILLSFVAVVMVSFVVQSLQFEKPGRATPRIAGTLFVLAYVGLLGSFIIQMRWFEGRHEGLVALVFLVATAKGADTGAYTVGRLAGPAQALAGAQPEEDGRGGRRRPGLRRRGRR